MQPTIPVNWLAVTTSVVASFAIGSAWYGPLFGKVWSRAMGFGEAPKPRPAEIVRGSLLNVAGAFLTAYVLAHDVAVWRPSTWDTGSDQPAWRYGFYAGLFVWLGFVVPVLLNGVAFERRSWKVFGIGAGYQFLSLQAMAMILALWR
jgi:hypothetical protein